VTPAELALVVFCRREEDSVRLAHRIDEALGAPITVAGHAFRLRPNVGVAISSSTGPGCAAALLDRAIAASERSAGRAASTPVLYDRERHSAACRRLELEAELACALQRGELHVEYQPVVRLPAGEIVGVEALARWDHPERGPIPPDEFVPIAEESGLIGALGTWVLSTACDQAAAWLAAGRPLDLAVNVSAKEVIDPDWLPRLEAALTSSGLPPDRLIIELTEGVFVDRPEAARNTLETVRELGVRVALDDFGTGYASLSYLRSLPFDTLKIDRSFVAGLPDDEDGCALVEAVLAIARRFRLDVVAEGVETVSQSELLANLGCGLAQGWHFGRPVTAARLPGLLPDVKERS
jgi:EAL domain-containing protein (putative c-di-GMP-specific phosphodiesterase class I)